MHHASLYHYNLPDQPNLRLTPAYDPTLTAVNGFIGLGVYDADKLNMESHVPQSAFYKNTFVYHATHIDATHSERLKSRG